MTHTTKHTPGPWAIAYYASQDGQGGSSHYSAKVGNKTIVRTVNQIATPTDEANMRLIAAAPAMYEALRSIPDHALDCKHSYPHTLACWNCIVKAALAQAAGE